MITIAVSNQKGGTAKTTTAVTLSHRLAMNNKRVLLIDTDVQGHVAKTLGMEKAPGIRRLVDRAQFGNTPMLIVAARQNLDIIPSDKTTEPAKRSLVSMNFRERVLSDVLEELNDVYDVAVIDCAPSVDVLHVSALVAADWLVVPSKLDYLAVDGVNEVLTSVVEIKQRSTDAPKLLGILPTFFDRQTNETITQLQALVGTFGRLVLPPIPVDTKLREAPAYGQTIWEYAPKSRSVMGVANGSGLHYGGYIQFIDRVLEVI
ncbi:MAG: ParA family protein [Chloroflexi bacterium]|nr:ParA family protein [Chloroflexota bacterium]